MRLPRPHPAALLALPIVELEMDEVLELDLEPDPEERVRETRGHRFIVSSVPALWDDPAGETAPTVAGRLSAVFMTLTAVSIIGTAVAVAFVR